MLAVEFVTPEFGSRRACWQRGAEEAGSTLAASDLDALAWRFRFTPGQIAETVAAARRAARWRAARVSSTAASPDGARPTADELFAAARAQSGHDLGALARRIEPKYAWRDIVLPPDQLNQLKEICDQARHRHLVFDEWGFGRKLSNGRGLSVLFSGPPGTGKTMSAEVIARELHLDLFKIDLSGIVSKYIGETEKNLNRIFDAAESADAILFFDEADALFGKRSEVQDAHDRYANIETAYLLQKMEEYEGVAILATNLRQNLDEAFMRRLSFIVQFPQPDAASRRLIWGGMWPPQTPLADDVDLDCLSRQFKLSGGNIKNIVLAAAFLAAEEGGPVAMRHLLRAVQREYRKLGRALPEAELARLETASEAGRASDSRT
jgi:SpoVK/Ycf46/Vps4 family AAA+-type ATPase